MKKYGKFLQNIKLSINSYFWRVYWYARWCSTSWIMNYVLCLDRPALSNNWQKNRTLWIAKEMPPYHTSTFRKWRHQFFCECLLLSWASARRPLNSLFSSKGKLWIPRYKKRRTKRPFSSLLAFLAFSGNEIKW